MLVKHWMSTEVVSVGVNHTMYDAAKLLMQQGVNMLPVMKDGGLVGIVTDRDLKRAAPSHLTLLEVKHILFNMTRVELGTIMTPDPITIPPAFTLEEAAEVLLTNKISGCPVVESEGTLVGVITKNDIFRALISLTGPRNRGVQFGLRMGDDPGNIRKLDDIISSHGGRLVSVLGARDPADEERRFVYVRAFNLDRDQVRRMMGELSQEAALLYMVDYRENKREEYPETE
ncbi:CBS and ACT domain-containing protein [Thermodesulfobacteriota bacterium]